MHRCHFEIKDFNDQRILQPQAPDIKANRLTRRVVGPDITTHSHQQVASVSAAVCASRFKDLCLYTVLTYTTCGSNHL